MTLRWLMTLGERNRPDAPHWAACPAPGQARAAALVDDCGQLFAILLNWRDAFGSELTGYANQVEADDLEHLPPHVLEDWGPDELRLDTAPGGYVIVADYRERERAAAPSLPRQNERPALPPAPGRDRDCAGQ
ncbi:hypothetical protein ACFU96_44255 [Streptomyces sp. NPDC057620]|uniref:hypothetical protein n=1 Tax=Streptomyces sp. NPDC057620 TaxID=3346185 RepID=UPI003693D5C3